MNCKAILTELSHARNSDTLKKEGSRGVFKIGDSVDNECIQIE